jgi:hypothetical protein
MNVQLSDELDKFIWNLTTSGNFSVKLLYADYMNGHMVFLNKYIWKLKVPLKIRMFMWFLHRKVLLTKDNLTKRKWLGCNKCAFCDQDESIEHLFIRCTFSKLVWRVVHFTFNLPPPTNVKKLFGNWLNGLDKHTKLLVRIGLCAIMWTFWNCGNDVIFNKASNAQFLQVVHKVTYWINVWTLLLPEDQRSHMDT